MAENEMENLLRIRKPLYRTITEDTLDKSAPLHTHYLQGTLTPQMLLESSFDSFTVSFYYNKMFDIMNYLRHLRSEEVTNISYNIMKLYLKNRSLEDVLEITAPVTCELGTKCLAALRGEIYRINKIEITATDPKINEYTILGIVTLHDNIMADFEAVLEAFIPNTQKVLNLFDLSNSRVQSAVCRNIQHAYSFLLENGGIYMIIDSLIPGTLTVSQFAELFNERRINKHAQRQYEKLVLQLYKKAVKFFTPTDFIALLSRIFRNVIIFNFIRSIAIEDIQKFCLIPPSDLKALIPSLATARSIFFYYLGSSNEKNGYFGEECENFVLSQANAYLSTATFATIKEDVMQSDINNDFIQSASLYHSFTIFLLKNKPVIEDILDMPEKFFIASLCSIGTEAAALLKEFNSNLLNDRIKKRVSLAIDKDILVKYLIKRHIWFDIDMNDYVNLMDDKYKLLYASNSLEWAAKNISDISRIGIPGSLYDRLNNSPHKNCLAGITKRSYSDVLEGDYRISIDSLVEKIKLNEDEEENAKRILSIRNTSFKWLSLGDSEQSCAVLSDNENSPNVHHLKQFKTALSPALEGIFNAIKENDLKVERYFEFISDSNDYFYIINSLFSWVQDSKYLQSLAVLFNDTLIFYDADYSSYKKIILAIMMKYNDTPIISTFASRTDFSSILEMIRDYPEEASKIADGLRVAYDRCSKQTHNIQSAFSSSVFEILGSRIELLIGSRIKEETEEFIKQLVYSGDNSAILVGSLVFSSIENPAFSLSHLLSTTSDLILPAVIGSIQPGQHCDELLTLLFTRGVLDSISALIIEKLDVSLVSQPDMNRIYQMFYISPLNYIKYRIDRLGFSINEAIVLELIFTLPTVYDKELFSQISEIISEYHFVDSCFDAVIQKLDGCGNIFYKSWALDCLKGMRSISLPYFVQLCKVLGNEDDLVIVRSIIEVLKNVCIGEQLSNAIVNWAGKRKLARLVRRVYPLVMVDREWYISLLEGCKDKDESKLLCEVYKIDVCCE